MDTKGISASVYIAEAARLLGRPDVEQEMRDNVRTWLLGSPTTPVDQSDAWEPGSGDGPGRRVIFHSAGYVGERSGPETTYNGIAIYYLTKAAQLVRGNPAWEWLWGEDGVVDRMAKFKIYQHFPNPDGYYDGPSGYAKRTDESYVYDQSGPPGRDAAIALLSDFGKPMIANSAGNNDFSPAPLTTMEGYVSSELDGQNFSAADNGVVEWQFKQHWTLRNGSLFYDGYESGTHNSWSALISADDDVLYHPYDLSW